MLEMRGLTKSFAGFRAVTEVDLAVAEGEIAAVIGPNGAGKSTLLQPHHRAICGRPPAACSLDGRDITGVPPHQICGLGMGRSFQRTNIFPQAYGARERAGAPCLPIAARSRLLVALGTALFASEAEALLASIGLARPGGGDRRHPVLRQPEAARARHRAGQRPQDPAARRADRGHVGERDP